MRNFGVVAAQAVRLVEDRNVPAILENVLGVARILDKVNRGDTARMPVPVRRKLVEVLPVQQLVFLVELAAHLLLPLHAQRSRHRHNHFAVALPKHQLFHDEAGFNRLTQTNFVGQNEARAQRVGHQIRGLNLMRQQARARIRKRRELVVEVAQLAAMRVEHAERKLKAAVLFQIFQEELGARPAARGGQSPGLEW